MSSRPTRVILVRHAEPSEDARGRCYGSLDVGLSDAGRVQAATLADALRSADIDAVFSSPRRRALQTADPVSRLLGIRVLVDDDLRELDFGELEGRCYADIAATMPDLYHRWMTEPTAVTFPGGESFADLRVRALAATRRIRADAAGATALFVTHAGVCPAIVGGVLEVAPELIFRLDVGYSRVTVIDWFGDDPVLRLMNGRAQDVALTLA
jgi:alpha-ribazole phosphatase